ncbi:MAG: FkbM family methyltransferase [Deltaproteobacteria bacterium]|nr:FkbM family methyltransferase [Deltaproteobacteria bacterium]
MAGSPPGNRISMLLAVAAGVVLGAGVLQLSILAGRMLSAPAVSAPASAPASGERARPYFAQQAEDVIVANIFDWLQIEKPTYLDVGAFDPVVDSNTFLFYLRGSQGVLVEPNPAIVDRLRAVRPRDKVLGVGIGVTDQEVADYYVFRNRYQLNTFSKAEADKLVRAFGPQVLEQVIRLPLVNINAVIADNFQSTPDLVSIDVEGLDLAILETLDFERYRPIVICVETLEPGSIWQRDEIAKFLSGKEYVVRGMTFVNTVFVDLRRLRSFVPASPPAPG